MPEQIPTDPDEYWRRAIESRARKARRRGEVPQQFGPTRPTGPGSLQGDEDNARIHDMTDETIPGVWTPWSPI